MEESTPIVEEYQGAEDTTPIAPPELPTPRPDPPAPSAPTPAPTTMAAVEASYMGKNWERFSKLADVSVIVEGQSLPAHCSTLAQHSEVFLDMVEAASDNGKVQGRIELKDPFTDKTLAGVLLFLKCCYQPRNIEGFMNDSVTADPSEAPLHELLTLEHFFAAATLLEECERHMCQMVDKLNPDTLTKWVGTAERTERKELQHLLAQRVASQLAEGHSHERIKEVILEVSADAAADIIAMAWEEIVAPGGPPGGATKKVAELSAALAAAEAALAEARAETEAARGAADAARAEGAAAADAARAEAGADAARLAREFADWLGPSLQVVKQDAESFTVEWTVSGFAALNPPTGVPVESGVFGPNQSWKVKLFPGSPDSKTDAVSVYLTYLGRVATTTNWSVALINDKDASLSKSVEGVSGFVPQQQDTWGAPLIARTEVVEPGSGFLYGDAVKIRVVVGPAAPA